MKFAYLNAFVASFAVLAGASAFTPALAQESDTASIAPPAASSDHAPMSADWRAERQAIRAACADDVVRLCPDVKTREDRRACMMQNHDKVSDTCKAAMADMRRKMQSLRAGGPGGG